MDSYAHKQAAMFRCMAEVNASRWRLVRDNAERCITSSEPLDEMDVTLPEPVNGAEDEDDALGEEGSGQIDIWDFEAGDDF